MADTPGNNTTTRTIAVGQTVSDTLETVGDHDWFRITLNAGQAITILVDGITLEDPYLYVRNASGQLLYENDDINAGVVRDSRLSFTATQSGTYFIDVAAWMPPPDSPDYPGYTGTYNLSVSVYTPPPIATVDQVANQLVSGYWGGDSHHFNVTQGGSITVNLGGLTPAGQTLARAALGTWTDIIGVNFFEVLTGGQIVFDDNEEGAHADGIWSNGITTSAHVNVSTQWLADNGIGLNSYSFQTYIHEIGHALGLGHAGNYNGSANYPDDALFQNDSWPLSIMSYFSQEENSFFAGQGFTETFILTPMLSDIAAMSMLYGLSTTTRTGNTTYGFNSNAGRDQFNASIHQDVAYTIFDSGGTDTLDYSGFSQNQRINLNPETFSNVGGLIGNVSIGRGVVIENAIGGSGSDTIIGNWAGNSLTGGLGHDNIEGAAGGDIIDGGQGNDTLAGGEGNDTIYGRSGTDAMSGGNGDDIFVGDPSEFSGDAIADFAVGDRLQFTGVNASTFTFNLVGSTLQFSGGSLTLSGVSGTLTSVPTGSNGLIQLILVSSAANDARNDFNGDGRSDILWRHEGSGAVADWLGQANGSFVGNAASHNADLSWAIVGTGDFNGDGRDDILWRHVGNGTVTDWLGQADGTFVGNAASHNVDLSWAIVGTGDFNGDNRDDVLWRNEATGIVTSWLGQANGSFASNNTFHSGGSSWSVVGTGDFNGDGRDDILWRHEGSGTVTNWLGQANGGFVGNAASHNAELNWAIVGTGDFNGDGRDDILWRHEGSGNVSDWLGQANGSFVGNAASHIADLSWDIVGTGDFNGDGRDDVLWRHDNGTVTDWLGQANGGFASNFANAHHQITSTWQVQGFEPQLV